MEEVISLIIVAGAFLWLMLETNWLTIRLAVEA
jgi:hypothetical protein